MVGRNNRKHRRSKKGPSKGGSVNKSTTSQMNEGSLEDIGYRLVDSLFSRLLSEEAYGSIVKDESRCCSEVVSYLIKELIASYMGSEEMEFELDPELVDHVFLNLMGPEEYESFKSRVVESPQNTYDVLWGVWSSALTEPEIGQMLQRREDKRPAAKADVKVVDEVSQSPPAKVDVFGVHPLGFVSAENAEVLDESVELIVDDLVKKGGVEQLSEQGRLFVASSVENRARRRQASTPARKGSAKEKERGGSFKKAKGASAKEEEEKGGSSKEEEAKVASAKEEEEKGGSSKEEEAKVASAKEEEEKGGPSEEEAKGASAKEEEKGAAEEGSASSSGEIVKLGETPPSPPSYFVPCEPSEIMGDFSYIIQGTFKNDFLFGITSRSKTHVANRAEMVTIIPFDSDQSANQYCEALVKFKNSPRVVEFVYLNEKEFHVLIERIEMDLPMYIDSIFCQQQHPDWSVSAEKFRITFRELAVALSEIIKEGHYCLPKLLNLGTISVSNDKKHVKLANLLKIKDKHTNSDRSSEMTDLALTMATFLTNVNETVPNRERMRNGKVPDAVINFISDCFLMTPRNIDQLRWMLDFSGFWDAETTKDWVYMASAIIWGWIKLDSVANRLDSILSRKLGSKNWRTFIPQFGRIKQVFDDFAGSSGNACEFNALIRFFRNVFEHYNDKFSQPDKLGDDEICELMESYFKGNLVVILRETLYEALLMRNPLRIVDWRDMLTVEMK